MESNFWHNKWEKDEIGFHISQPNPLLTDNFKALNLTAGSRVFLPLCGKTLDIAWLLSESIQVVGAELSQIAIEQLFDELGLTPSITECGLLKRYSAESITIFVGDIFELDRELLGPVDAIYDRAALVALPEEMRKRYTQHLREITDTAPQLLITFEYDQSVMNGPPFSITGDEVKQHYQEAYQLSLLTSQPVENGLKGICPADEGVWLLKP